MGSSTLVMAVMEQNDAHVRTLNLGDSGVMIVRPKEKEELELVFRSREL